MWGDPIPAAVPVDDGVVCIICLLASLIQALANSNKSMSPFYRGMLCSGKMELGSVGPTEPFAVASIYAEVQLFTSTKHNCHLS
jgi:hypothetical protein